MDRHDPAPTGGMKEQLTSNIARLEARRRAENARATLSDRIGRNATRIAGSMPFIALHIVLYFGALLTLTVLMADPFPFNEGLGMIGSAASTEGMFLALFVLLNQRREEQRAEARADFTLHVSLLSEHELSRLATVIHRMAERLDVPVDEAAVQEVEKNVDPEQVLDALEELEEDGHAADGPGAGHGDAGTGEPPAMKDSTAS